MKKALILLVAALVAGLAAFMVTRSHRHSSAGATLLDGIPELAWLRGELSLSDAQFAKACDLHTAYRPTCEEMCRRIDESHKRLEAVAMRSRSFTPELEEAVRDYARVRAECQEKMLRHLYQTADLMDANQAGRYLEQVLPAALGSGGQHHSH